MHRNMLSVVFKNFSMEFWVIWKSKISSQSSSFTCVCRFLDTILVHLFVIALCRLQCIPTFNLTSKLYWLYSVHLVSILSSYLPHLPFSSPFFVYYCSLSSIFASFNSVFAVYVASSLFTFLWRWRICSGLLLGYLGLFAVSWYKFCTSFFASLCVWHSYLVICLMFAF